MENKAYIFNLETTKIELHFEKSEYNALSDEQKKKIKGAFLWSRRGCCWVSRAKEPNLWYAKQVAKELGFTEEQRSGERLSYAEQVERQSERAEARAERYSEYADNAVKRAEQFQKPINNMHGDIAFFTQPNINTASGRAFTNHRNRMFEQYKKGFEEYRKSEYFKERAQTALATASKAQFKDPAYLDRRIKECKKEIRSREKKIISYEETLYAIENGETKKRYNGEILTAEEVSSWIERELELVEKAMDKQGYLENCLDELGGIRFGKDSIKVGYVVTVKHYGKVEVLSTGPVNFTYKILSGGAAGCTLKAAYAEIGEIVSAKEKEKASHPFKVGEQFKGTTYCEKDRKFLPAVYEIVKTSTATIQLKRLDGDGKTITRKPALVAGGKRWRFSIDDSYGNTFYRETE